MRGRERRIIACAAVLLAAGLAWAGTTRTPVESEIVGARLIDLGEWFIDDLGILHVRGQRMEEFVKGDLEGSLFVTSDLNVDWTTWTGDMHGRLRFVGTWGDLEGVFEGTFSGTWDHNYFDGDWVMKGTGGEFAGLQLRVHNEGPGGATQTVEGVVLDPGG